MNAKILCVLAAGTVAQAVSAGPMPLSPWDYSVFGLSGVGSPSSRLTGTVNGTTGSAGDVFMGNISAGAGVSGYAVVSGGQFNLSSGTVTGNIFATGNASVTSATIGGSLMSGGTLYGSGGSVSGSASAPLGNASSLSIGSGFQQTGLPGSAGAAETGAYFAGLNGTLSQRSPTTSYTSQWGQLSISAAQGLNIVDISSAALDSSWGVQIAGPSDATVILRVSGVAAHLDSISWSFSGGAQASNVLANYFEAESLNLSGGHTVSFLAPNADVIFSGNLTGSLIGDTIAGGGSLNGRAFTGDLSALRAVPAPSAGMMLLGCGAFAMARRRRG